MLEKLLRHEFRATVRIMGPLYLVLLLLSFCFRLLISLLYSAKIKIFDNLSELVYIFFFTSFCVVSIMTLVLLINRFRANLMSDEGYVMFTLPASVHELVWSKIIVSIVWSVATFLVEILSTLIYSVWYGSSLIYWLQRLIKGLIGYDGINGMVFLFEFMVLMLLQGVTIYLQGYASISLGYRFTNHKNLLSVVFFFAFEFASQMVRSIVITILKHFYPNWTLDFNLITHITLRSSIISTLIFGVIFYAITVTILEKHLNLE